MGTVAPAAAVTSVVGWTAAAASVAAYSALAAASVAAFPDTAAAAIWVGHATVCARLLQLGPHFCQLQG